MRISWAGRGVMMAVAVSALMLVGCGDDGGGDDGAEEAPAQAEYEDPAAMADALGCADTFSDLGPVEDEATGVTTHSGDCSFEGEPIYLEVITDAGDGTPQEAVAAASESVCEFAELQGITELISAQGPNWVATGEDPADAEIHEAVAEQLGGEAKTLTC